VAAKSVATSVPDIIASATDPVRTGLVTSLARPDRNMTGMVFGPTPELSGKVVWNPEILIYASILRLRSASPG
jgi:hypothetical protein